MAKLVCTLTGILLPVLFCLEVSGALPSGLSVGSTLKQSPKGSAQNARGPKLAFATFPDIRVAADPFGDISWGLPAALLLGEKEDYAIYINKLRLYRAMADFPELPKELPNLATMQGTLQRLLLDTPDKRLRYYRERNRTLSKAGQARAGRELKSIYRPIPLAHRAYLVDALTQLYKALIERDNEGYLRQLADLEAYLLRHRVIVAVAPMLPIKAMQEHLRSILNRGIGEHLNTPVQSNSLDCSAVAKLPVSAHQKRIALDAGHFGGNGVRDSREYKGYREGRATFIVAHLVKAYLTQCGGLPESQVMLTRYDLYGLPGNARISIRNNALMDYRSELLELFQPDLAISLHTDGGPQRISIFTPSTRAPYYFYRGRGFYGASTQSAENSIVLAKALMQGLEERLVPLAKKAPYSLVYRPLESVLAKGRSKVFQNLFTDDIPLALVEGFSHAPEGMTELLLAPDTQSESIRLFGKRYSFHPILRFYAEGVAQGIGHFFVQKS